MLLQILNNLESSNNQDALPYVSSKECLRSRARRYVLLIFFWGGGNTNGFEFRFLLHSKIYTKLLSYMIHSLLFLCLRGTLHQLYKLITQLFSITGPG